MPQYYDGGRRGDCSWFPWMVLEHPPNPWAGWIHELAVTGGVMTSFLSHVRGTLDNSCRGE